MDPDRDAGLVQTGPSPWMGLSLPGNKQEDRGSLGQADENLIQQAAGNQNTTCAE